MRLCFPESHPDSVSVSPAIIQHQRLGLDLFSPQAVSSYENLFLAGEPKDKKVLVSNPTTPRLLMNCVVLEGRFLAFVLDFF